jgi:iron complex outermembrane receptor protein
VRRADTALFRTALFCGLSVFALPALAQETAEAAAAVAGPNADAIGDIVVTARFRTENLQSTPLSVSAIDGGTLSKFAITDVQSVQRFLPNVQLSRINFAGNALGASIRGISFADLEKTFDPAIGVAIDGVFLGTNTGANIDFTDIESIEVLRGPQGTLYGRNTIGGTISVRRTRPTGEAGVKLHGRYGSYGTYDLDAVVNLPKVGDLLSVKLFGLYRQSDSFTRNRYTGEREPGRDYWNAGAAFQFEFGEDTTILASVDYQKDRSFYPSAINLTKRNNIPFGAGGTICDFTNTIGLGDLGCDTQGVIRQRKEDFKLANTSIPFLSWLDGWNSSLEINTKIGDWSIKAITGYRDTSDQLLEENTGTPPVVLGPGISIPLFVAARDQTYSQFSQEVRVSGDITEWMDLVAGVYYLHTDYAIRPGEYLGARNGTAFILNGPIQTFNAAQKLDSFAVFAESIFKLGDTVRLTVGGRYTTETKKFEIEQLSAPPFSASAEESWSDPTGRVILDWKPVENVMFYGSWSRGFRSGGFNGRATSATSIGPYDPERVDSFEAGMKGDFWDGRIRVNPTVFWAEYSNKQEEIIRASGAGTETIVENAASARIRGIELELQAKPNPDLLLRTSVGYLDARYKTFLIPDLANPGTEIDVSDQRNFRRAPDLTFTMGADYTVPLNERNEVNLSVNYSFIDDIFTSPQRDRTGDNRDIIAAYGTLDASISLLHTGVGALKSFRINAYGRDLLNGGGRLSNTLDAGVFWFGVVSPRREMGIEATINF